MSDSPLIDVPTGRKLDESPTRPKGWFGDVRGLPDADEDRVELARRYFVETSDDEYEHDGKVWISTTGERFRVARFDPLLALDPTDTGVERFVVREADALIFLRREGVTSSAKSVHLGSVGAIEVQ